MIQKLIKKDSKNKLRIIEVSWEIENNIGYIYRISGIYNGTMIHQPVIYIPKGKVKRTLEEQTILQYNSIISEYLNKGYKLFNSDTNLETILTSIPTDTNDFPKLMLAKEYDKWKDGEYYCSRKIDGCRAAILKKDTIMIPSRGGKQYINSVQHLINNDELNLFFNHYPNIILDGELYIHGLDLQTLSGLARNETKKSEFVLKFYLFDLAIPNLTFKERLAILNDIKDELPNNIVVVDHYLVKNHKDLMKYHDQFVAEGYEGAVIRKADALYGFNKRSKDMQKVKMFKDDEFKIIGYSEGLRDEDMVFIMETKEGKSFEAKPIGDRSLKQCYLNNINEITGKYGVVKFFNLTDNGIPFLPVFKCIKYD